jgi:hypothetical protein
MRNRQVAQTYVHAGLQKEMACSAECDGELSNLCFLPSAIPIRRVEERAFTALHGMLNYVHRQSLLLTGCFDCHIYRLQYLPTPCNAEAEVEKKNTTQQECLQSVAYVHIDFFMMNSLVPWIMSAVTYHNLSL